MDFRSDNVTGIAPRILRALEEANAGTQSSYGADTVTADLERRFAEIFEREVQVFPVVTGTAANALALAQVAPPWGAVYCHRLAHVEVDECGAPEFFTGGAKLALLDGAHGKINAPTLKSAIAEAGIGVQHHAQPAAVSISQATECGAVYRPAEVAALAAEARRAGLRLHMDGARFANALACLGCSPADLSWRAGVDVLSFGATKNGALAAEAVVFFDGALAENFLFRRKRAGHLFSKMRFLSAQLLAYLEDDAWLVDAAHANAMAFRLAEGLRGSVGCEVVHPPEANEVFVRLPKATADRLGKAGVRFHPWSASGADVYRMVTAWSTDPNDVARVIEIAAAG